MSNNQPVKPKVTYSVYVNGLILPMTVTCDDVQEDGGYIRYYDGETPVAIVPAARLVAAIAKPAPSAPDAALPSEVAA